MVLLLARRLSLLPPRNGAPPGADSMTATFRLIAAVAATLSLAQQPDQQARFRSTAEAVSLEVSVRRSNRTTYTGLKAEDFEVLDNGVKQEIVDVTYGKLPIDVTIALDVSYSVSGSMLERLRRAVTQLMRDMGHEDRLKLILFNARINRVVDFTRDITAVERALTTVSAGGGTTVYDTLSVALVSATAPDRRQLIVCFSDGADSNSTTDPEVLIDVARRTRATIGFVLPPPPTMPVMSSKNGVLTMITGTAR